MVDREKFINDNIGLVHSCCRRFRGRGIDYDDLFQAGCIGLIKATDSFDESRGLCFSTYAVPVILGEVKRMFRDGGTIKVSRSLKELSNKIKYERERSMREEGRELSVTELAVRFGVSPEEIAESLCATQPIVSLTYESENEVRELELSDGDGGELLTDRLTLTEAIKCLSETDQKIISLRYFASKTQNETAKALSMSQVQVSRAEKKILENLRLILRE